MQIHDDSNFGSIWDTIKSGVASATGQAKTAATTSSVNIFDMARQEAAKAAQKAAQTAQAKIQSSLPTIQSSQDSGGPPPPQEAGFGFNWKIVAGGVAGVIALYAFVSRRKKG